MTNDIPASAPEAVPTGSANAGIDQVGTSGDAGSGREKRLPRRDWILLPLLAALTICLLAGATELMARKLYSASTTSVYNCIVQDEPSTGFRAIPNSVCWEKALESQRVEYRFNSCGQRAETECGAKRPGDYRIALPGSSMVMGDVVPQASSFSALDRYLNEVGHATIARLLAKHLSSGAAAALRASRIQQTASRQIAKSLTTVPVDSTICVAERCAIIGEVGG